MTAPTGYTLLNQEFDITAPDALSASDPLRFVFKLDATEIAAAGVLPGSITVFRNGTPAPNCDVFGAGAGDADPVHRRSPDRQRRPRAHCADDAGKHLELRGQRHPPAPRVPTTKDDCKKDGWKSYGMFKNQGDCVSYVATHGKNGPLRPLTGP